MLKLVRFVTHQSEDWADDDARGEISQHGPQPETGGDGHGDDCRHQINRGLKKDAVHGFVPRLLSARRLADVLRGDHRARQYERGRRRWDAGVPRRTARAAKITL